MGVIADLVQDRWGFHPGDDEYETTYAPAPAVVPKPTPAPAGLLPPPAPVLPNPPALIPPGAAAAAVPPAPGMVSPVAPRPTFSSVPTGSPNPGQGRAGGIVSLRTRIAGDGHVTQDDPYGVNPDDEGYAGDYGVEASRQALEDLFGAGKDNVVIDEQGNAFFYGDDRQVIPLTAEERGKLTEAYGDRILRAHTPTSGLEAFPGGAGAAAALGVLALGGLGGLEWTNPQGGFGLDAFGTTGLDYSAANPNFITSTGALTPEGLGLANLPATAAADAAKGMTIGELASKYGRGILAGLSAVGAFGGGGLFGGGGGGAPGGVPRGDIPGPPPPVGGQEVPGGLLARRVAQAQSPYLAPAQGYFPALATVPQPTDAEIEIGEAQLELMRQGLARGENAETAILQGFGYAADPTTGQIRHLTEDEYLGTLTESQRGIYELQLADIDRQRRALDRETPVSEGLQLQRDREYEQLREALARQGHALTGDEAATAVATSTAGAQRLGRFNERYAIAEEAERAQQLARGTQDILGREGLFGALRGERAQRSRDLIGYSGEPFRQAAQLETLHASGRFQRGLEATTNLANQAALNEQARFRAGAGNQFSLARAGFGHAANLANQQAQNQADRDRANAYNLFRYNLASGAQQNLYQQQLQQQNIDAQRQRDLQRGAGNLFGRLVFGNPNTNQYQGLLGGGDGGGLFGNIF